MQQLGHNENIYHHHFFDLLLLFCFFNHLGESIYDPSLFRRTWLSL